MADNIATVVMLDRSVYENKKQSGTIDNNTIYFVRESTSDLAQILSLYVGQAWQCDMLDITEDPNVTFDETTNEYDIPVEYRVNNKLLFYKQTIVTDKIDSSTNETYDYYRIVMWDGAKFRDCVGLPNNVIVCSDGLPDTANAIRDFVYIDVTNTNMYVFDGNSYISVLNFDPSVYATKDWVEDYHNSHASGVEVDGVTILKSQSNVLYGAGADVSGVTFPDTLTASNGANTFNSVDTTSSGYNEAVTPNTSAFGYGNREKMITGTSTQTMNNAPDTYGSNIIAGCNNATVCGPGQSIIVGKQNSISISHVAPGNIMGGYSNSVLDATSSVDTVGSMVFGSSNRVACSTGTASIVYGYNNSLNVDASSTAQNLVQHNTSTGTGITNSAIIGSDNTVSFKQTGTSSLSKCVMIGANNNVDVNGSSVTNSYLFGSNLTGAGDRTTVIGHGNSTTYPYNKTPSIVIGNDYMNNGTRTNRNAAVITTDNDMYLYGNAKNIETDVSLVTKFYDVLKTPVSQNITLELLPTNSCELVIKTSSLVETVDITSITLQTLSCTVNNVITPVSAIGDYCATIVFKPLNPIADVTTLLTNFYAQSNKVYLINPDVDISTYTVIHLLLFYDGFNLCCTVGGYQEVPA
jgi:hypothetical protein